MSEEELDAINEENVSNAAAAKAMVESLRRRREARRSADGGGATHVREQADVEQRRIAVLAEGLANVRIVALERGGGGGSWWWPKL